MRILLNWYKQSIMNLEFCFEAPSATYSSMPSISSNASALLVTEAACCACLDLQWVTIIVTLFTYTFIPCPTPFTSCFSLHMLFFTAHILIPMYYYVWLMTANSKDSVPYLEACSHVPPVFNLTRLCYQALGLIFCTNTKSLVWSPACDWFPFYLWIFWSSGHLPDSPNPDHL
jgi:hypothetical protein